MGRCSRAAVSTAKGAATARRRLRHLGQVVGAEIRRLGITDSDLCARSFDPERTAPLATGNAAAEKADAFVPRLARLHVTAGKPSRARGPSP